MSKTMFFNNIEYTAEDFVDLFKGLTNNGIRATDDMKVIASTPNALTVDINGGKMFVNGYFVSFDTTNKVNISANTSGYNRKDLVCVKVDTNNQTTEIVVLEGIPSSSPVVPSLPVIEGENYVTLAILTVGNNVNSISNDNIEDKRLITKIWDDYNCVFSQKSNGYIKFPNGIIFQWGMNLLSTGQVYTAVTLPIKFPNACLNVSLCKQYKDNYNPLDAFVPASKNPTYFNVNHRSSANYTIEWLAIGY